MIYDFRKSHAFNSISSCTHARFTVVFLYTQVGQLGTCYEYCIHKWPRKELVACGNGEACPYKHKGTHIGCAINDPITMRLTSETVSLEFMDRARFICHGCFIDAINLTNSGATGTGDAALGSGGKGTGKVRCFSRTTCFNRSRHRVCCCIII